MDTEYKEKRKNLSQIEKIIDTLQRYEPLIKLVVRGLLSLVIWVVALVLTTTIWGVLALSGSAIPSLLFFIPFLIAAILTFILWNEDVYQKLKAEIAKNIKGNIAEQISEKFKELSLEELQEAQKGLAELKEKLGFDIDIELPAEKRKRDQIDNALSKLSDSQLLDLKRGINDGSIGEDDLLDWLNEQETMIGEI